MSTTANFLTPDQTSKRLANLRDGLGDAAAVMIVEWRSRAEALRRRARWFLSFIIVALLAGIGFVLTADILVRQDIKGQIDVLKIRKQSEFELHLESKYEALKKLEERADELGARRQEIIRAMESLLQGGGSVWHRVETSTTATLSEMHFADATTGWVIGREGTLLQTTDGKIWTKAETSTTADLWEMHFADATTGWVIGANGTLLQTTDGKTWTKAETSTTAILLEIHFTDATTGWVIGRNGTLLMTRIYDEKLAGLKIGDQIDLARSTPLKDLFDKKGYLDDLKNLEKSLRENQVTQESLKVDIEVFGRLGAATVAPGTPTEETQRDETNGKALAAIGSRDTFGSFSLQTGVIRGATILLIAFLVQILVNLYRYNTRLASYYDARADAVLMTRFVGLDFEKLVHLLSPDGFDFGRQPKSPAGNAVELAREILRVGRQRA